MKSFYLTLSVALLTVTSVLHSQTVAVWKDPIADVTKNFYTIQQESRQHFNRTERELSRESSERESRGEVSGEENEAEFEGYFQYKRWEDYMAPRVYPSGDLTLPSRTWEFFNAYMAGNPAAQWQYQHGQGNSNQRTGPNPSIQTSSWTFAGPTGAPTGGGAGRVGFVRVDPTNANNIWIGAPAGGLWKSTNGGSSWSTNTDFLSVIGASDVVIDPTNTQNMYLATGDGDAGDTYSIGVMKSTDGGTTWNPSLSWTVNQGRVIRKLLMNPTNPLIVMAFSNAGIWRTTNGGTSWTQVQSTNSFTDAEFQPGTPNTVYACGTRFWRSTDGGATWTQVTTGVPANTSVDRLAIAVTAANTTTVYMVAGSAANDGFYGFYKSTNSGTSFTQVTVSSPSNMLGWASAGNDSGGQGWYDLTIDASPTNANEVCVGGVNLWRTTNGGSSWTLNAHWTGSGAPYVHADHHAMIYTSSTTMYVGCDGGIFKTTNNGGAWTDISNNLCIAQIYRIGLSASNASYWITGHQDNGTNLKNGATYSETMGGDGMDCFVDRTNNNTMYGEQYNGSLNRTTNGGGTWNGITTGLTGTTAWVTPWYQDPTTANTIYCGRTALWKSTNQGTSWTSLASLGGSGTIVDFKVAPSNNQVIYVCRSNAVFKTTNGGASWTTITGTLPVGSAAITRVDVKPTDPNTALITFSGYSSGNKVFKTTNGGTSWTNISTGLPNLPCNCVRFDASSAIDGVYVGCDVGVYYMDNTFTSWQPYFTALPNVPVYDLEVYTPTGKLRAASYGRGVWEVDIYNPGTLAPIADFTANRTVVCPGDAVNFTDMSAFTPTTWSWSFQGGTPATSTVQNPTGISWSTPGTYSVTLTAGNANGSDVETKTSYITVLPAALNPPLVEGFENTTFVPTNWIANNINNDALYWDRYAAGRNSSFSARFDNYNMDVAGTRDEMWCPRQTFASASTAQITFDVAYARYNASYTDTLELMISTDCGQSWSSIYLKGGTTLATVADQTSQFTPTNTQWRNEVVSLNSYVGQGSVLIKFVNRGHYGNCIFVDNVNITTTVSALPSATFTASATSVCAGTAVSFTDNSTNSPTSWTWTFPSGTPASATTQNVASVVWNTAGTYTVTHTATNASGTGTTTQTITVLATPTVTTTATPATICSGQSSSLTASGASTYTWMPGSLTGTPVTVTPASTTTYTVTGTAANGCTTTSTRAVTVNPTPTVTATAGTPSICSGSSTTLTGSGASTYTWMPGSLSGSPVTVTPAATTTYTVTGTGANGCTSTQTVLVTVTPSPTVTVSASSTTICSGSSTTLTASGATTYTWMPGSLSGTSVTVSPATTTTYTVTGTTSGCTGTATRLITVNATPTVTASASSTTICSGSSTTLTGTGASTYTWNPGSLSGSPVTVTPASTTTYTMTGTAANGCTATATRLITVNASPTVTATAGSPTICPGGSTTLTATGASTYNWNPGSLSGSSVTVTPASTTTYTATGTAANGCTGTQTVTVTVNPTPTVTISASSTTICNGSSTTMTATGATTYTWMPGSLSGSSVTVSPGSSTTYTCTGTSGCSSTATQLITVNASPTVTASSSTTTICGGSPVTLTATGGTSYSWMPGSLSGSPVTVTPTVTTTYTVTGTSANGCTATATQAVTVNAAPAVGISASTTSICTGGSTTLTGSGASTYNWMPGSLSGTSVTVTPASTTTYTVTGTGANGCTGTQTIAISVGSSPTVTATASNGIICLGSSTTLTGNGATTYNWMPGSLSGTSVTVSPTVTTTYTVTGTNGPGCSNTNTVVVTVNPVPVVTASSSTTTVCSGSPVTFTGSGATTYNWMPGSLSGSVVTANPTSNTTYTVTGTDGNGCTDTYTFSISVNNLPNLTVTPTSTTICLGNSTTISGSPTTGNVSFSWSPTTGLSNPTAASTTATPTTTTTYTLTKTVNTTGCTRTGTATVNVDPGPSVSLSATSTSICAGSPVTLTATGAASYTWMPGSLSGSSVTVTPAATTTYTATGTGVAGCTSTETITITVGPAPTVTASSSSSSICIGSGAVLNANGATNYNWMPGSMSGSSVTVTPSVTTSYTVTGDNGPGCSGTATVTVTVNSLPTVSASASSSTICAGNQVTLTGSGASSYDWMPGSLSGVSVTDTPSSATTYTVTGTDANGCSNTNTVSVAVNSLPVVTLTLPNDTFCAIDGPTMLTGASPAGGTYSGPGVSGGMFDASSVGTGTYTITYTYTDSATGCSNSAAQSVVVDVCNGTLSADPLTNTTLQVTPNPNDGEFNLTFDVQKKDNYILEIHNELGQIVYREDLLDFSGHYSNEISLKEYGRGAYTIRLRSEDKEIIERVITF